MNDLKTCMGDNVKEFSSWLLSVKKDSNPKEICHIKQKEGKDEGSILKGLNVKSSLALIYCRQKADESQTSLIYRLEELLTKCCGISAEECTDQLKLISFSNQLGNDKIACRVIKNHPKTAAHAFHIVKEEEKGLRIIHGLSKENVYPVVQNRWEVVLLS